MALTNIPSMKNVLISLVLLVILGCTPQFVQAQYSTNQEAVSIRAAFPNYQFQFANDFRSADFTFGLQLEYTKHLSEAFNLAIPLTLGAADYPLNGDRNNVKRDLFMSLDALLQLKLFKPDQFLNPALYFGVGGNLESTDHFNFAIPLGIVLDMRLSEFIYLSPKIEYRVGFEDDRDNFMPAIGLKVLMGEGGPQEPSIQDRDGDGIADDQDLCPDQAGTAALNGCPDQDGDGIADGEDNCPTEAGPRATNGCPDNDSDGIPNAEDQCPDQAGPASNNGCPVQDQDNDGIADDQDQCPTQPGSAALNGCPDQDGDGIADNEDQCPTVPGPRLTNGCPDNDSDGVPDASDRCPNTPGTINNNGCPELAEEDKQTLEFAAQNIQFETASSFLKSVSRPILEQVADIMRRYPGFRLSIDGHTDSIGSALNNQRLSERRAKTCYDYLVAQGISAERMSFQGLGEAEPIADNRTKEGRELNRRVEFNIIQN